MDYDTLAKQNGGSEAGTPGGPVDYDTLATKTGGVVAPTAPTDTRNIAQKVAGAFVDPFITLATRPGQMIGAGVTHLMSAVTGNPTYAERGDAQLEKPMTVPFFGTTVKPISQETTESMLGEGVSTVALGLGNPTVAGAAFATGNAMENNDSALSVTAQGILGGIAGKLTEVGFQKLGMPIISAIEKYGSPMFEKLASVIPDAFKSSLQHVADAVSAHTPSTEGKIPILSDLIQGGKNLLNKTGQAVVDSSQTMRQSMLNNAYQDTVKKYVASSRLLNHMTVNAGTDPVAVLSAYGNGATIPEMSQGKINPDEAIAFLKDQIGELSGIKTATIKANNVGVPLSEVESKSKSIIDEQGWSDMRKQQAKGQVQKIIDQMNTAYPEGSIPLTEADTIKSEQTALSKSYNNNGKDPFVYDAHSIVGKTARKIVEDRTNDAPTKALNKWIQSHYDAIDLLESLRGKAPNGGLLTQSLHRLGGEAVGTAGGMMIGHPWLGALTGHFGSNAIDGILGSNFITNPIKRSLIEGMQDADPAVVKAALKWLSDDAAQKATRLALPAPAPTPMELPGRAGSLDASGVQSLPAGTISDMNGVPMGHSSTGENIIQSGTRKLPVRGLPSDYSDRFYPKKLPIIEMGQTTPKVKSKLPTIR